MNKVLLVDGNNLAHRGLGISPMSYEGERTEVIQIGLAMLKSYLTKFTPDECVMVWDYGRDKRRTSVYPEYKKKKRDLNVVEKREKKILFKQMDALKYCIELLGIPQYACKGREADDLIYNIIKGCRNCEYVVVSTDEDMFQLLMLSYTVFIYSPIKKIVYNRQIVEEKFGIPIKYFPVYKALVGDKSDNILGIRGAGPVAAVKLIDALVKNSIDELSDVEFKLFKKMGTKLFKEILGLVEFKDIQEQEFNEGLTWNPPVSVEELSEKAMAMFETFGFERFLDRFEDFINPFEGLLRKIK